MHVCGDALRMHEASVHRGHALASRPEVHQPIAFAENAVALAARPANRVIGRRIHPSRHPLERIRGGQFALRISPRSTSDFFLYLLRDSSAASSSSFQEDRWLSCGPSSVVYDPARDSTALLLIDWKVSNDFSRPLFFSFNSEICSLRVAWQRNVFSFSENY